MDIYCPICEEPWDTYCINEEAEARAERDAISYEDAYRKVQRAFYREGCNAFPLCYGHEPDHERAPATSDSGRLTKAAAMSALIAVCGDDLDGVAAMMDDALYMGWVE